MLLATPALEAPVFLSATSPESTMPKQLVLTEADLASRWAMQDLPFYCVNRLVRFRLGELHQWQIAYAHKLIEEQDAAPQEGDAHA